MKLLIFGEFYVVFILHDGEWRVAQTFRHYPGRIAAEPVHIGMLPWTARQTVAEIVGDSMP